MRTASQLTRGRDASPPLPRATQAYIESKSLDRVLKPLMVKCFRERPEHPLRYMMKYLKETYPEDAAAVFGAGSNGGGATGKLGVSVSAPDADTHSYLNETLAVGHLFEGMCSKLLEDRPSEPVSYIANMLNGLTQAQAAVAAEAEDCPLDDDEEEDGGEDVGEMDETFVPPAYARHRRGSVSAECGGLRQGNIPPPKKIAKTEEEIERILAVVSKNILFSDLDQRLLRELCDAVFPVSHSAGSEIIKQGEEGDNFYIVDSGECEVFVSKDGDEPRLMLTAGKDMSFGNLALMYNAPRAATVIAKTDVKLWAIDRATFRGYVCDHTNRKRKLHEGFLGRVPLLQQLSDTERARISDSLIIETYKAGDTIIKQGEPGDKIYILEEGTAKAEVYTPDSDPIIVKEYSEPGDFFGELALLTQKPRAASVVATTDVVVIAMDAKCFRRLVGPCEAILQRNVQQYKEVLATIAAA